MILSDGPRAWAVDLVERKLGRVLAAVSGLVIIDAVAAMEAGIARQGLAAAAVALIVRAAWPLRVVHPASPASLHDLVEVERAVLELRQWAAERELDISAKVDGIAAMVAELRDDQVG